MTGISRKHTIVQLHGVRQRHGGRCGRCGRLVQYGRRLAEPLQVLWRAAGYCCAELLHAGRERLLQQLMAHGRLVVDATRQQLLLRMSCPALKRYLRRLPGRRLVRRRARRERRLRRRVPLSVSQPKPRAAGTFECDVVEHNGGSSAGEYIYTVHVVDVVTAWRSTRLSGQTSAAHPYAA